MKVVEIDFPARDYQRPVIEHFRNGGKHAFEVWHRRAGKDRTATFIESELAFKRVGLFWHALPEYKHARRVIWDAITRDGQRLIDLNFPAAIVRKRNEQEMKIELVNGSIWQLVGADNFDSLVGSNPVHVTFSEFALMHPKAREFIRPILAENGGTDLYITTPRGYNHAHELYQHAKRNPETWHASLLTVEDTNAIPADMIEEERRTMPDELFRQEFYCDFSAANVGAILGRYLEQAEREGRICDVTPDDGPIEVSSDIGFRDTACWWFWQPKLGGFDLIDYEESSGLDADDWIDRLKAKGMPLKKIWLPHDAKVKTFQSKHSALERFLQAFGADRVGIVPDTKKSDRINAARMVLPRCRFHATTTAQGLAGLRAWSFEYNEETRAFSKEPRHDWASHPGDGFSYGAVVMRERVGAVEREKPFHERVRVPTFNEIIAANDARRKESRI